MILVDASTYVVSTYYQKFVRLIRKDSDYATKTIRLVKSSGFIFQAILVEITITKPTYYEQNGLAKF